MARRETSDPASPLWQADILGTGLGPNDSQIDDDAEGPVNIAPTVDYAPTDPMVDGVEAFTSAMPPPPPGSIATHVHIGEHDDMLSGRRYSMFD